MQLKKKEEAEKSKNMARLLNMDKGQRQGISFSLKPSLL